MRRRYRDVDIWSKAWHRALEGRLQNLWTWLCDNCDPAGIIDVDWGLASFQINFKCSEEDMGAFGERVKRLSNGKWWLPGYILFQNPNGISMAIHPHRPIFASLTHNGIEVEKEWLRNGETAAAAPKTAATQLDIPPSLDREDVMAAFEKWVGYQETKGKRLKPETLNAQLAQMATWGPERSIAAINNSILKGYRAMVEPGNNGAGASRSFQVLPPCTPGA